MPEMTPPPMTCSAPGSAGGRCDTSGSVSSSSAFRSPVSLRPGGVRNSVGKNLTHQGAISRRAAVTRIKFAAPSFWTSDAVTIGPAIAPSDPPTAMKAKSRFACSLLKTSVMNAQKSVTTKRLKTLTQT